jgi:hypothetical protein
VTAAQVTVAQRDQRVDARDVDVHLDATAARVGALADRARDVAEAAPNGVDAEEADREPDR